MPRSRVASLLLVSLLATSARARAQPSATLSAPTEDPLGLRLSQELTASGVAVHRVGPDAEPDADSPVFIRVEPGAVRLWIRGEPSTVERTDDATSALAVAEAVRARLAGPTEPDAGPTPEPEAAQEEAAPPVVGVWLTGGIGLSPGEIDPFVDVAAGVEVRLVAGLYVEAFGVFAVPESQLTQRMFDFTFWTTTFGAGLGYSFLDDDAPVALRAAVGVGPTLALVDGDDAHWAVTPYARLAFSVRVVGPLSVRLDGLVGVALPELDLRFRAGWRSGFGLPRGSVGLGLQLDL